MMKSPQRIREAEQMLNNLTLCDETLAIPGNFRAKQRRVKHDDSKLVFPVPKRKRQENFSTHYNMHFKNKIGARPSSPRPCSPTRRNNPHPSKNFLNWRIPTRVFDYGKEKEANISLLKTNIKDTYQSFYDDYCGNGKLGGELDAKMLLEMAKSYGHAAQRKERTLRYSHDPEGYGCQKNQKRIALPNLLRQSWQPGQSSSGMPNPTKTRKQRQILSPLFMKPEFQPLFQSWYDAASEKEKKDAQTAIEEVEKKYIQEALSVALKSDAIKAIEQWLLMANDEEREIAMQFIKAIIIASAEKGNQDTPSEPGTPSGRPTPLPLGASNQKQQSPIHHHHTTMKACEVCHRQELEAALQQLQAIATMPMEVPGITELLNPLHPAVVAERNARTLNPPEQRRLNRPKQGQTLFNVNKGSLFVTSKKRNGKHFTIHPEWY